MNLMSKNLVKLSLYGGVRGKKPAAADMLIFSVLLRRLLYDKNHKLGPSGLRQMIFAIRYARKTVKICQTSAAAGFFALHSMQYPACYSSRNSFTRSRLILSVSAISFCL